MRIAVNTRWLLYDKLEGIGVFTHQLLKRIVLNNPEVQFDFFFDRPFNNAFIYANNVKGHIINPPARHPKLWYIWYEIALHQKLKRLKPDLFFSPDGLIPSKTKLKTLGAIHDLNFEHHPEWLPKNVAKYYKKHFKNSAQNATQLITVSEYSKKDLRNFYNIDASNIDVVYNASEGFEKKADLIQKAFREQFTQGNPYFLFVGALNPRKNLKNIFKAYDRLNTPHKLLVVGNKMHWSKDIEATFNTLKRKEDVIFTNRLNQRDLNMAYSASTALVFPSFFEGFGIPIIEAFNSGTAVITAINSALPEIAGDAALFVNAHNADELSDAMLRISKDDELRNSLIEKGINRAAEFSWDDSAGKLWEIMVNTINS